MDPKLKLEPNEENAEESKGNSDTLYASLIGSLMYLTVATRPDISYVVNRLAAFTANPSLEHWTAAKKIL